MSSPPPITDPSLQERIHGLWDELATFEAARNEDALMFLLEAVAGLVGAQNAYWLGTVRLTEDQRDPLCGWRPRIIRYLRPLPNDEKYTQQRLKSLQQGRTIDEATVAQVRLAGAYRASRLRDLVSEEWFQGDTYRLGYRGRNVHDSLTVGVPVSATAEVYYGFLRLGEGQPFTEEQRDLAFHAMRGLMWFHRQTLLTHGVGAAAAPLSPMERRVLAALLTDQSEKAIAAKLALTPSTVHTYVKTILKKFGESGRGGLVALWLGQQG